MEKNLKEALKHRRSYYALSNRTTIPDSDIEGILDFAALHTPSAFNSQSSRMVLLLGEQHRRLWNIVRNTLKNRIPATAYASTEAKIDKSFAAGYGTILFFEDTAIIKDLQKNFPTYQEKFPQWSQQTSGMHQLVVWTLLEDAGFGASLQHYNPLIDEEVLATWELPATWELIAQMPFGIPLEPPKKKEYQPLRDRVKVFSSPTTYSHEL